MTHPDWYLNLVFLHLATVLPATAIGTYLLLNRKGTPRHRALGKLYMGLMGVTAITVLFMPAQVGPQFLGHFGFIHILSAVALSSIRGALAGVRNGNIRQHRQSMIGLYAGGILIAGSFALMPGRLLHGWLFGI